MFGITSINIIFAFVILILSAVLCVIYGILTWNRASIISKRELKDEVAWVKEEHDIDDSLTGGVK